MKYLKLFEQYKDIESICDKYGIGNYTINKDGSIDVDDNVDLSYYGLSKLSFKFNVVNGYFDCSGNKLITLEGCPKEVIGNFDCSNNQLVSLIGCPERVDWFSCMDNKLIDLKGGPKFVKYDYDCSKNEITSLEGLFDKIGGNFHFIHNPIEEIIHFVPYNKIKDFINIYNDYNPIKGNIISKFKMDQLFDELEIHNFDYDELTKYIIK